MDEAQMAARMYPGTTAAEHPAAPPVPATDSRATTTANLNAAYPTAAPEVDSTPQQATPLTDAAKAQRLFQAPESLPKVDVPENIAALRDADTERKFYPPQVELRRDFPDSFFDRVEAPTPLRAAAVSEMREIAADVGLRGVNLQGLITAANTLSITPPTVEQEAAWRGETQHALAARYGKDADQRLADAKAFVARDPRVAQMLEATRLGSHPATIMQICELALRARVAGKLS